MKKVAIGCAVLLVLGTVGAGGASYVAYRKASSTFAGFVELGSLPELERSVRNQRLFEPPADGEASREQIERLLEIQQAVRARLGQRADQIEHRYRRLLAKDSATAVDLPELISACRDLAAAYVDAKRAQVDALYRPVGPAYRLTEVSAESPAVRKLVEPRRKALEANVGLAFLSL